MMTARGSTSLVMHVLLAMLASSLAGCAMTTEADASGGETNWLKCESDAECGAGSKCRDRMCVPEASSAEPMATDHSATGNAIGSGDGLVGSAGTSKPPIEPVIEAGPDSVLDLAQCAGDAPLEWIASSDPSDSSVDGLPCATGMCRMRFTGVSALDDERFVVLGLAEPLGLAEGDESHGYVTPSFAVLEADGSLGSFSSIPGVMPAREVFGVGRFVVVLGENDPVRLPAGPSKTALFEWREGGLADMGIIGKVAALAMQGSRLSVAGTQTPVETSLRDEAWLAAYEGSTVGWRITRPDEAKGPEDASHDVALDLDGSSSWIVRKYIDMGHALVRVDPDGNPLWTTTLGPSVFGTGTPADSYFAPQVATAGGVTSVAGQLSTTTESSDVLSTLSFRQYDAAGIETRRWNGLTLDEHDRPAVVPVVADADGNVYTLWPMPNRAAPSRPWGFAILRFAGAGDPCVLTEVELARTPTRMVLRGSELLFAAGRIGRVRL